MVSILQKVIDFASEKYKSSDGIHGVSHAKTTAKYAEILARTEGANIENCVIAAWLHDIARKEWVPETQQENHGVWSARISRPFLESLGIAKTDIDEICTAISEHCFPNMQTSLPSKILWDSDKLNHFDKGREKEYLKYLTKKLGCAEKARQEETEIKKSYLPHFQTKTARKLSGQN